jgi:glycosyltransferase involved in cell wall biosynthesis
VAEGFRDGLRLPGSGFHRRMPVVFDGIRLSQLEVLVVDDGFTDASAQIASRFQVRLLTRDRLGLSEARNMALEQARGGFVA